MRLSLVALLSIAMVPARAHASATGCDSGRTLADLSRTSEVIVFGTIGQVDTAGYELADGTVSKAAPGFGVEYRGSVKRFRIKVIQVIKGQPSGKLRAFMSVPVFNLGNCTEKPLGARVTAVFFLGRRSSEYWVVEGQDGVVPTGENGVSAIVSQFTEPVAIP
jgi:hypothetical protein